MSNLQWRCGACERLVRTWKTECPYCGAVLPIKQEEHRSLLEGVTPLVDDAQAPERIPTGFPPLDRMISGGIPRGKYLILFGVPGCNKSTLGLQCASLCTGESLYVAAEWSRDDAALRATELQLPRSAHHSLVEEDNTDRVCELIRTLTPELAVIDSLHALWSKRGGNTGTSQLLYALGELKEAFESTSATGLLISKTRKDGEFKGPQDALHAATGATLRLAITAKNRRLLSIVKTRISPAGEVRLVVDDRGLRAVRVKSRARAHLSMVSSRTEEP